MGEENAWELIAFWLGEILSSYFFIFDEMDVLVVMMSGWSGMQKRNDFWDYCVRSECFGNVSVNIIRENELT